MDGSFEMVACKQLFRPCQEQERATNVVNAVAIRSFDVRRFNYHPRVNRFKENAVTVPHAFSRQRLSDFLIDPREHLDFEIKNWLDIQNDNDAKATFAKAALALANHGGGFVIFGLTETAAKFVEAAERPLNLSAYSQDAINGIVQAYAEPAFHCEVHIVQAPSGAHYPIVVVPGGHRVPVRAKRSGPHGKTVEQNAIYVRKPGPKSEVPTTAQEWDSVLARCLSNRRDELLEHIRTIMAGAVPQAAASPSPPRLDAWIDACKARWRALTGTLPPDAPPRCPRGHHWFAYEIDGVKRPTQSAKFPELLQRSVVRHTGWPPFWYPTRSELAPYPMDGSVECWLGREEKGAYSDAAHSDFWRISPKGLAFLLRGYQEDGAGMTRTNGMAAEPGTLFDISQPIWRAGEVLLHAESLSRHMFEGATTIELVAHYSGLAGRELTSLSGNISVWPGQIARQGEITLRTRVEATAIAANLPEIVQPLLAPLYALFEFSELPMSTVSAQIARMRSG